MWIQMECRTKQGRPFNLEISDLLLIDGQVILKYSSPYVHSLLIRTTGVSISPEVGSLYLLLLCSLQILGGVAFIKDYIL